MPGGAPVAAASAAATASGIAALEQPSQTLADLFKPHVESFNSMLLPGSGLELATQQLPVMAMDANPVKRLPSFRFWIESVEIGFPSKTDDSVDSRLWPSECRELGLSYTAPLMVTFASSVGDGPPATVTRRLGCVPIMARSQRCHLANLNEKQLLQRHEEATEQGGFFIVNGIDRLVRLLIVPRRHYVTAMIRPSFVNRGPDYTKYGCAIRCVRSDESAKTITLHYLSTGSTTMRLSLRKQEFFIPSLLLLRALTDCTDREIYERLTAGQQNNAWVTDRVEAMIRQGQTVASSVAAEGMQTRRQILAYLGQNFRFVTRPEPSVSDEAVGQALLDDCIFVHVPNTVHGAKAQGQAKFDLLCHMISKLYALVQGRIKPDNPDALHCQEILLPGHLYQIILKEKLEECLLGIKQQIVTDIRLNSKGLDLSSPSNKYFKSVIDKQKDVGKAMHYFVVTGNLISSSGLDLMQTSGFTIVGEKLNYYRYLSHFRSVHRGQFFTTMKTTDVRKLLPESFGFQCVSLVIDRCRALCRLRDFVFETRSFFSLG